MTERVVRWECSCPYCTFSARSEQYPKGTKGGQALWQHIETEHPETYARVMREAREGMKR